MKDRFRERAEGVGAAVAGALRALLATLPPPADGSRGPSEMARELGLNIPLTSRLLKALRSIDPISVLFHLPGVEPLRTMLNAVERAGATPDAVEAAGGQIEALAALIREEAGDRSGLNAMLTAWLPDERLAFELRRKQAVFKSMSEIQGLAVQAKVSTALYHPATDPDALDVVGLAGLIGLYRIRGDVDVTISTQRVEQRPHARAPTTLDGRPMSEPGASAVLTPFCDPPDVALGIRQRGDEVRYTLEDDTVGPHARFNVVLSEVNRNEVERYADPATGEHLNVFGSNINLPIRALQVDVLRHRDLVTEAMPVVHTYPMYANDYALVHEEPRAPQPYLLTERVTRLYGDARQVQSTLMPDYPRLLEHVFDALGWDPTAFIGHRCVVEYPIFGSNVGMSFERPER